MSSLSAARLVCPELVGRDAELATIAERIAALASGAASTILVSGEAGLGKSALLTRAIDTGRHAGLRPLRADCVRLEMRRAFGPFIDALRSVHAPGTAVREALTIAAASPSGAGATALRGDHYFAHAAFTRALSELATERRLLLAIDDLHWADDASLELFSYLSHRLSGVVLVGSFRPDELRERATARHAIADVRRDRLWELPLRPLTAAEVGRALRLMLGTGTSVSSANRELLGARCAGNPLFLEEMLRALAQRGDLEYREEGWRLSSIRSVPLPESVHDAVRERFESLDTLAQHALTTAAVIGERFSLDLLAATSGLDERDLSDAIQAGLRAQLIVDDLARGDDCFAFRHPLVRDAIAGGSHGRERRELHRRIAGAIERSADHDDQLSLLAYHWDESGNRERAFDYHRRAAEHDRTRMAYAEALRHFERARQLAPEDDRTIADLLIRIAEMYGFVGPALRVMDLVGEAMMRFERLGDSRAISASLMRLRACGQRTTWTDDRRYEASARAHKLAAPLGDSPELTWALTGLGEDTVVRGDVAAGIALVQEAVAVGERCHATWELAVAYWSLGRLRWWSGDAEGGLAAMRTAADKAEGVPGSGLRMDVFCLRALHDTLRRTVGDTEETRAVAERLRVLAERYGGGVGEARTDDTNLARLHQLFARPSWDEFLKVHDDLLAENNATTFDTAHLMTHRVFVMLARDGPAAMEALRAPLPMMLKRPRAIDAFAHVAQVYLLAADHGAVLDLLEPLGSAIANPPLGQHLTGEPVMYALLAAAAIHDGTRAIRWIDRANWDFLPWPYTTLPSLLHARRYAVAERAALTGDRNAAIAGIGDLVRERNGAAPAPDIDPVLTRFMTLRHVELLAARGATADRELAASELATVVAFYQKGHADWYLARLRERADEWNVAFPVVDPTLTVPALTPREREVAALVGQGLTNREIAERLTLSVRTAESHVDQIRTKLGFRTRAQIAGWVASQRASS